MGVAGIGVLAGQSSTVGAKEQSKIERLQNQGNYYEGIIETEINYTDSENQEVIRTLPRGQKDVSVIFSDPISAGATTEQNPFHLVVLPGRGAVYNPEEEAEPQLEGILELHSAFDFGQQLGQYWQLQEEGPRFSGQLTNPQLADDLLLRNYIYAWQSGTELIEQVPLGQGTQLDGERTGSSLEIDIVGNTIERDTPFTSEIRADRV